MKLKKMYYDFPKMRGGGLVKGRLELFRKFILFGGATKARQMQILIQIHIKTMVKPRVVWVLDKLGTSPILRQIGPRTFWCCGKFGPWCGKLGPDRFGPGRLGPGRLGPGKLGPSLIGHTWTKCWIWE